MFHVGQHVICVRSCDISDVRYGERLPVVGTIYTVRDVGSHPSEDAIGIRLNEIVNRKRHYIGGIQECWFDRAGFRPIDERKTDISVFRKLLNPTKQQIRESIGRDLGFTPEEIG